MTTIVTRSGKGEELTFAEMDSSLTKGIENGVSR